MLLSFTLSMPRNNAWNGKWTGEADLYAKVRAFVPSKSNVAHVKQILASSPYLYDFGDGWTAKVSVSEITPADAQRIRKQSRGFYGYDWMVQSILDKGKIIPKSH